MRTLLLLLALTSTSCQNDHQLAQPLVTTAKTQQLIAATAQNNGLFEKTFRLFVSERNLVGLRAIIENSTPKNIGMVRELILHDEGVDAEFAHQTYPLLRKILRERSHQSFLVKSIVGQELVEATGKFADAVQEIFLDVGAQKEESPHRLIVPEQLVTKLDLAMTELEVAYERYEYMHVNIAQGSDNLGRYLRRYVDKKVVMASSKVHDIPVDEPLANRLNSGTLGYPGVLHHITSDILFFDLYNGNIRLYPHLESNDKFRQVVYRARDVHSAVERTGLWPRKLNVEREGHIDIF